MTTIDKNNNLYPVEYMESSGRISDSFPWHLEGKALYYLMNIVDYKFIIIINKIFGPRSFDKIINDDSISYVYSENYEDIKYAKFPNVENELVTKRIKEVLITSSDFVWVPITIVKSQLEFDWVNSVPVEWLDRRYGKYSKIHD